MSTIKPFIFGVTGSSNPGQFLRGTGALKIWERAMKSVRQLRRVAPAKGSVAWEQFQADLQMLPTLGLILLRAVRADDLRQINEYLVRDLEKLRLDCLAPASTGETGTSTTKEKSK